MILPDWYWRWRGRKVVSPFDPAMVNVTSLDMTLAQGIRLQRYQGVDYADVPAWLVLLRQADGSARVGLQLKDPEGLHPRLGVDTAWEPFQAGDAVLAITHETLKVPNHVRLQGMLKSSAARAGIDHRTALYIDPGFHGQITLELDFRVPGWLVPGQRLIQVEAALAFPRKPYRGHYVGPGDGLPVPNRNMSTLGFLPADGYRQTRPRPKR